MKRTITLITTIVLCLVLAASVVAETDESGGISLPELTDPVISIKQETIPTVKAGTKGNIIEVKLENTTFSYATDITVKVISSDPNLKIDPADSIISVGSLSMFSKATFSFPIEVAPSAAGTYSIAVEITCKSTTGLFVQNSHTFNGSVSVVVESEGKPKQPTISDMKFDSSEYFAGNSPTLSFTITNPNSFSIYDVSLILEGFIDGAVDDTNPDRDLYISELKGGASQKFTVEMQTSENIAVNIYNFSLSLSANDGFGASYSAAKSAYFSITEKQPDEFTDYSPRLIVDSYKMIPSNAQPGDTVTIELKILNLGVLDAENAKIALIGYDSSYFTMREVTTEKSIGKIAYGESVVVSYSTTLSSVFPQDTPIPLGVSFSYSDLTGKNYTDAGQINITSVSPKTDEEDEKPLFVPPVYKVPKVIIESFETDIELVNAGEEFLLTFTLKNTSEDLDVENIRITLMDTSSATGGSVFTPVNSGYSFYIEKIGKLETHTLSIPLFAKVSTESGIYSVNFSIDYEYYVQTGEKTGDYRSHALTETVSLKVVQPINIEVSNLYFDTYVTAGGYMYLSFSYNNKSRSNLYFMNIDIEGDAYFVDGKQEMGSIPSGYSDYFDASLMIGNETGEQTYYIVFTFKDSLNKESQIKYPFTVMVSEMPTYDDSAWIDKGDIDVLYPEESYPENEESGLFGIPYYVFIIAGGAIVLVTVVVVVAVVLKKKKAKNGEDEDENI